MTSFVSGFGCVSCFDYDQCYWERSVTSPSGSYNEFGIVNLCNLHLSFYQCQFIVPLKILKYLVLPNPFMVLSLGWNGPTKSFGACDIYTKHLLSIPIISKSLSQFGMDHGMVSNV